jgi:4-carboxymuconolactone decarboxylase
MKTLTALGATLLTIGVSGVNAEQKHMPVREEIGMVSPALEKYARGPLAELWQRPGLAPRDRSIVTVAALIARNQTADLENEMARALDNDVTPAELSEIITHLAFYSGWSNASAAAEAAKEVFANRSIGPDRLPEASPPALPLDAGAEADRAQRVDAQFGKVAPGVVQYTTDLLFRDLWLRPGLAARDRSLTTVSALVASGQVAQIPYHLNRAMNNGLTATEMGEALTQLAFYAGWPTSSRPCRW